MPKETATVKVTTQRLVEGGKAPKVLVIAPVPTTPEPQSAAKVAIGGAGNDTNKGAPAPKIPPVQVPTTSEPSSGVSSQKSD